MDIQEIAHAQLLILRAMFRDRGTVAFSSHFVRATGSERNVVGQETSRGARGPYWDVAPASGIPYPQERKNVKIADVVRGQTEKANLWWPSPHRKGSRDASIGRLGSKHVEELVDALRASEPSKDDEGPGDERHCVTQEHHQAVSFHHSRGQEHYRPGRHHVAERNRKRQ